MANNYYDMTGVLVLKEVTPVIKALFGVFELDGNYPGNGQAYIAYISESTSSQWDSVLENLVELAEELGLSLLDDEDESVEACLERLAEHFGASGNEQLVNLIENGDFDNEACVDDLFMIAKAFDDGHGLTAFKTESSWHCSKPRLFEFGGAGNFTGSHVSVEGSSNQICDLGESIEKALSGGDIGEVANILHKQIGGYLAGIYDSSKRDMVKTMLCSLLAQTSPKVVSQ